jgi:molybdate transport system substrate-binding protein
MCRILAWLAVALALAAASAASAGLGSGCAGAGAGGRPTLTVFAAASLQRAFGRYAQRFGPANVRYSFAGSDTLGAQVEQGLRPDVFASADVALPERLYREGLVERPRVFAANRLVLAAPSGSRKVTSLVSVERRGLTLAIGEQGVPIGAYARKLLARLSAGQRAAILADARDQEQDVSGIVGKLLEGAVDAGFLYATDVAAVGGRLKAIELPAGLRPNVAYAVAIVKGTPHPAQARAFIAGLEHGAGRRALLAAGFLAPRRT